jgi:hypothetical protein
MNKVTLAFAAATAGLMLLSVHLWRQLDAERSRTQQHKELQAPASRAATPWLRRPGSRQSPTPTR